MLKKRFLALAVFAAGTGSAGMAQAADDGTIHFTGTISASACSVTSVADSGSTFGTVGFGQLSNQNFAAAGDATPAVPFTIELSHCSVSEAPKITFKGVAVTTASYTDLFASQLTGVGIRIEDAGSAGRRYLPGVSTSNSGFDLLGEDTASATGRFNAYLVAYNDSKPTGNIDTDVTFVIDYTQS